MCPGIGEIKRIRVSHDNSGIAPGWYLEKVHDTETYDSRLIIVPKIIYTYWILPKVFYFWKIKTVFFKWQPILFYKYKIYECYIYKNYHKLYSTLLSYSISVIIILNWIVALRFSLGLFYFIRKEKSQYAHVCAAIFCQTIHLCVNFICYMQAEYAFICGFVKIQQYTVLFGSNMIWLYYAVLH